MNRGHSALAAAVLAGSLALGLSACGDSGSADSATPETSSTPSKAASDKPSTPATAPYKLPKKSTVCKDGKATVTDSGSEVTIDGDCGTVHVKSNDSIVKVKGAIKTLIIDGALNDVTAKMVGKVTINSDANSVNSDNKPDVTDKGKQNEYKK
ncbi:hypothetical protein H9Y04_44225 [Streptomyces sp. TRM66268-LWL]|uniref:DUF3060 domain-containing protein n=1 Tax=Streptomyces polyasparticus TaxID=2767826 RepID=A0ABR7SXL4_9ACTN|nr:hypothetical protein [Streptomyces polyasparticus]MBC9719529.1 hypothetical protein [Streptomyces polyasparticus]